MPGTINLLIEATAENGSFKLPFEPGEVQITQNNQGGEGGIVTVGTTEEDMGVGDVGTEGVLLLINLDSANNVEYGPKNGSNVMEPFGLLRPGEPEKVRLKPGVTLRWKAITSPVKVYRVLLED